MSPFFYRDHATVNELVNAAIVFGRIATKYGCFRDTLPAGSKYLIKKLAVIVKFKTFRSPFFLSPANIFFV